MDFFCLFDRVRQMWYKKGGLKIQNVQMLSQAFHWCD